MRLITGYQAAQDGLHQGVRYSNSLPTSAYSVKVSEGGGSQIVGSEFFVVLDYHLEQHNRVYHKEYTKTLQY